MSKFSRNINPAVTAELEQATQQTRAGNHSVAFCHLENAHVLGQESTYWHVKVHCLMLFWGFRNKNIGESAGQLLRIVGAATKTVFGMVPAGNTGGTNVSPFMQMPISEEHQAAIALAKQD